MISGLRLLILTSMTLFKRPPFWLFGLDFRLGGKIVLILDWGGGIPRDRYPETKPSLPPYARTNGFFRASAFQLVWGILLCDSWVLVRSISKVVNAQIGCQCPLVVPRGEVGATIQCVAMCV